MTERDEEILTIRTLTRLSQDVSAEAWDGLVGDGSPFLEWGWLASLEDAGCVGTGTGWGPHHLTVWKGERLIAACPLYLKGNSEGEFVFDYAWANAAEGAGIEYYPKMLVAVPFTPAEGLRFLVAADVDRPAMIRMLGAALIDLCRENEISSIHVNFCAEDEAEVLQELGYGLRLGYQFKWRNHGYEVFDDYLAALKQKRRKEVKRERRILGEQEIVITPRVGDEIPDALFDSMYKLYLTTVDKYVYGRRYLTPEFFDLLRERFRRNLCFLVAERAGELIAGTFNVQKSGVLYGRYWGTFEDVRFLHFNVCYYATIEHCIDSGLRRFEPGAGGEFKWLRGFDAEPTRSLHWLRDPRLGHAIENFLESERQQVEGIIENAASRSPLRKA
ncbi:MAG: GNAT family N-acetyltransferase [Deltaproteobacteria bacterium]